MEDGKSETCTSTSDKRPISGLNRLRANRLRQTPWLDRNCSRQAVRALQHPDTAFV